MENILELQQVSKTFPKSNFTLENVTFSLPYGAILGFVGENGAGKTTTIGCILNTITKDSGTVKLFGNTRKPISTGWLYIAEERPRIYGLFEICPDFVTREITGVENITSLPQLSLKYMNAPIDYCSMTARMGKSARAAQRLGLEQDVDQPLMYWEEKIYDIDDHLVAVGEVFIHPSNMELSVVTRFNV